MEFEMITAEQLLFEAMSSGAVTRWKVDVVHKGDEFDYQSGSEERIFHKPNILATEKERGPVICAYSIVTLASGATLTEVMRRSEIDKCKAQSKAKDGPWKNWFDEMAKKAVLKRQSKRFANTPGLKALVQADHDAEGAVEPIQHDAPTTGSPDEPAELVIGDADVGDAAPPTNGTAEVAAPPAPPTNGEADPWGDYDVTTDERPITEKQRGRLFGIAKTAHGEDGYQEAVRAALKARGIEGTENVRRCDYAAIVKAAETWSVPISEEPQKSEAPPMGDVPF